jgi:hypothetical protein
VSRFFSPSKPRAVEGGLKARSRRGAIAQTWWSERFIAVLEGIGMGNRLQRGRSYARTGQVISLGVDAGSVTAQVQGSRARPYRVRVGLQAFGKAQWANLERELAGNAWYLAKLLRRYTNTDNAVAYALADYNAGRGNVLRWMKGDAATNSAAFLAQIGFPSTRAYIEAVTRRCAHYQGEGP